MIVVQATLLSAIDGHTESLGRLEIANDGTGDGSCGHYNVALYSRGDNPRKIRSARIENWPRNSKSGWALVTEAVEAVKI